MAIEKFIPTVHKQNKAHVYVKLDKCKISFFNFISEFDGRVDTQRHYTVLRLRTRKTKSALSKYPFF